MKIVTRMRKAVAAWAVKQLTLSGVDSNRGWLSIFRSNTDGTWQYDTEITNESALAYTPFYACLTLIASDIGKICLQLMEKESRSGIWVETSVSAFSPLLRKPNHFQTRQQFIECWVLSKLIHGNAYILKIRDGRQVVKAMYVLDPTRVMPLVAPDGSVYYQIMRDDLSKLPFDLPAIPAAEIIHDRMECLFHPLVGISPLFAVLLPASQGLRIQNNSEKFFKNMSRPSGMLTAPTHIDEATAVRLKKDFEANYGGENIGRLFVAGDALKYEAMVIPPEQAQLVEQLGLSAVQVCSGLHVPPYMIGVGPLPSYNNVEALNQQYYSQCLQKMFNAIEDLLDDGLGLHPLGYRTEFDLDDLLRMDTSSRVKAAADRVGAAITSPDEERRRFGLLPVPGGASPYLQQQNYSLAALAKRDAMADPFATAPAPAPTPKPAESEEDETDKALHLLFRKSPEELLHA
jgi:HK97 family phage portal protein